MPSRLWMSRPQIRWQNKFEKKDRKRNIYKYLQVHYKQIVSAVPNFTMPDPKNVLWELLLFLRRGGGEVKITKATAGIELMTYRFEALHCVDK